MPDTVHFKQYVSFCIQVLPVKRKCKILLFSIFRMENKISSLDWNDTFLSVEHLYTSFPGYQIEVETDDVNKQKPPFR